MPRYVRGIVTWISIGAFITAVALFGFEIVWHSFFGLLFVACAIAWPAYLLAFRYVACRRPVAVEGGRLVQRTASGRVAGTIDLSATFEARCVHDESDWTLYRVRQGREVVRLVVPIPRFLCASNR